MKKTLLSVLTTVAILTSGISVLAGPANNNVDIFNGMTDENGTDSISNMYTTGGISDKHSTIIVVRTHDLDGTELTTDISERIAYIDQSTSVYSTVLEVIFNEELESGFYKVTMGGLNTASSETAYFVVGDFDVDPDDKLKILDEEEPYGIGDTDGVTYYKKSFKKTISYDDYNEFKSLKLISADGTHCIGAVSLLSNYTSGNTHGYAWNKPTLTGSGEVTLALQIYGIPSNSKDLKLYFSTQKVSQVLGNDGGVL